MLSRPMRVPSAATQLHESPCLPPVDWMMKCRAFAGGFARSAAGTCASAAPRAVMSQIDAITRCMLQTSLKCDPDRHPDGLRTSAMILSEQAWRGEMFRRRMASAWQSAQGYDTLGAVSLARAAGGSEEPQMMDRPSIPIRVSLV